MKLSLYYEEGDKGTSIELADAIIKWHEDRMPKSYPTDDDVVYELHRLEAVAEHILVYLKHRRYNLGWR